MPSVAAAGSDVELSADAQAALLKHAAPVLILCLRLAPLEPSRAAATLRKLTPAGGWLRGLAGVTDCFAAMLLCYVYCLARAEFRLAVSIHRFRRSTGPRNDASRLPSAFSVAVQGVRTANQQRASCP